MKQDIAVFVLIIFIVFFSICFVVGLERGFQKDAPCHTGRIITDNWVLGLGYQLACKR